MVYVSRALEADPARLRAQAEAIALASAPRNARARVTGALAVGGGWFAQILEGRAEVLVALFDRILADPRHADIRLLDFAEIGRRRFHGWSMAWSGEIPPDLAATAAADYLAQERHAGAPAARHVEPLAGALRLGRRRAAQPAA